MKALINFLQTLGSISKPKKAGSQGINIYNPSYFDTATLDSLCKPLGFSFIHQKADKTYTNPDTGEITTVPPKLFVGLCNSNDMNADETESFLSDLV